MGHKESKPQIINVRGKVSHRARHIELHKSLDELFADYITHGSGRTSDTILDLINWSYKQTDAPDHDYK